MARPYTLRRTAKGAAKTESAEGAETVVATLEGIDTSPESGAVELEANVPIAAGAESVLQIVRIRRTGLAGEEVAKVEATSVAGTKLVVSLNATDKPGEVAGQKYVITLQGTATRKTEALAPTLSAIY